MNEAEALELQLKMAIAYKMIKKLPLDKAAKDLDHALTLGPLIDPTLWMEKHKDAERTLRIINAFRKCRDTIAKEFPKGKE